MAVSIDTTGGTLKAAPPKELFTTALTKQHHHLHQFDVTQDGQRFLINTRPEQTSEPITIYANWESELKK